MPVVKDQYDYEFLLSSTTSVKGRLPKASKHYRILAVGDSWFKYPKQFFAVGKNSNIVDWLGDEKDFFIESDSENGRELLEIFSGDKKNKMLESIHRAVKKQDFYDVLLVSGGGNDIVGEFDFDWMIRENPDGKVAADFIRDANYQSKIARLKACYTELIERVVELDKGIRIITHQYDYAIPMAKGFLAFDYIPIGDSWMYPFLVKKNITDLTIQAEIMKTLFLGFAGMLSELQNTYPNVFHVVATQGTLTKSEWRNEIHPTPNGFKKISKKVITGIRKVSPRR